MAGHSVIQSDAFNIMKKILPYMCFVSAVHNNHIMAVSGLCVLIVLVTIGFLIFLYIMLRQKNGVNGENVKIKSFFQYIYNIYYTYIQT